MKALNDDNFVFNSGSEVYAHGLVIGIDPELQLTHGYDGHFPEFLDNELTSQEKIELADYMIELWTKYKQTAR